MEEQPIVAPGDPVSWRAVQPGAAIYGSDGGMAGTLREVQGDDGADIFHGLVVDTRERTVLVPADAVGSMTEDRVDVSMPAASIEALESWSGAGASAAPVGEREATGEAGPPEI